MEDGRVIRCKMEEVRCKSNSMLDGRRKMEDVATPDV
jgi:hypothetical protein